MVGSETDKFLKSMAKEESIKIIKKQAKVPINEDARGSFAIQKEDGYLFTINDKIYGINSDSFEIKISQSLFRSGEDLKSEIKITSTNIEYPIYIVDPKSIL